MFGKNPTRKPEHPGASTLWVQEVFATIQGEGPFSGERAVFVRLAGCSLACWYCDTEFESSRLRLPHSDLAALVACEATSAFGADARPLVVITGGEPLRQPIGALCELLLAGGYRVQIETSGAVWTPLPESPALAVVVSPKTPKLARECIARATAWKYVLRAGELAADGLPSASTQRRGEQALLARPPAGATVFVSPCDEHDPAANAANSAAVAQSAMRHGYRVSLQVHKLLGVP